MTHTVKAYGTEGPENALEQMNIARRETGAGDVRVKIKYCGICHSDIHVAHNDWGRTAYPLVPGHEIVGEVIEVGGDVTKFKKGQIVGVGCLVDSCLTCEPCEDGEEQYCAKGATQTYGYPDKHIEGAKTYGGYSEEITVREEFILSIPENLDLKAVAPLLCAGITTYSPLNHWKIGKGDKVGVIGLGGLGHMGVKLAVAMGADVTVLTRSADKTEDAKALGAKVLITTDKEAFGKARGHFDFLLNTVPVPHPLNGYLTLLNRNGAMVIVGAIDKFDGLHSGMLIGGRKTLAGSLIGGIEETQKMLDFCGEHNIVPEIEMCDVEGINKAFDRVMDADVRYRFVIDMDTL